uniref:Uncharacterized protein n=1 Tax=Myoviridae sp. ctiu99 TaxID=2825158 RepID=A0A8S5NVL7_9CAUD|nr:MAG TPA: hypothetical protein [Myoviridae sp. ctiu99]
MKRCDTLQRFTRLALSGYAGLRRLCFQRPVLEATDAVLALYEAAAIVQHEKRSAG